MKLIDIETFHLTHSQSPFFLRMEPCIMALGFFDGVHLGHQKVIRTARQIAREKKVKLAVMTFAPHPKEVLSNGNTKVHYLTPLPVKVDIFDKLGVDRLYVITFNQDFAELSPQEFINQYVIGLGAIHVVAGFDFTYGFKGQGNMDTILEDGRGKFQVTQIPKLQFSDEKISSTLIRQVIGEGDVERIPSFLGDYYETRGKILLNARGHYSADNTLIVSMLPYFMLPAKGVYEIETYIDHQKYQGIARIDGLENGSNFIEMKLFDRVTNLVNQTIKIKWIQRRAKIQRGKLNLHFLSSNHFESDYIVEGSH